jgi:pyridoxamine 5'-phosphate oxidase
MNKIADIRKDYKLKTLDEIGVDTDAIKQFSKWWDEVVESRVEEANAMTLATATPDGKPAARIVLLKGFDSRGFIFYTNYQSAKGDALAANPHASLVFFWKELERQVRIEGVAEKLNAAENDAYFASRPAASRIGAWASPQSSIIKDREAIEKNAAQYQQQFGNGPVPRPPHWGGYIVKPTVLEFWQGRPSRLHDRIQYTLQENGSWQIARLAP